MLDFESLVTQCAEFEGFRKKRYYDEVGIHTIGYGFTAICFPDAYVPETISKESADIMLKSILESEKHIVNNVLAKNNLLAENERKALLLPLTDFKYNCGIVNLKKLVLNRDFNTICKKILLYNKAGGKVLKGLEKRRNWEYNQIMNNYNELTKEKVYTVRDVQDMLCKLGHNIIVDGICGKLTCKAIMEELSKNI